MVVEVLVVLVVVVVVGGEYSPTTIVTVLPLATLVPALGDWLRTIPFLLGLVTA